MIVCRKPSGAMKKIETLKLNKDDKLLSIRLVEYYKNKIWRI